MERSNEIVMLPIESISVANPRVRNRRVHKEITENIHRVGLKRPISVRRLNDGKFALICGQGRLEAYQMLGQSEIPALIVETDEQTAHVMSVVENVARRNPRASETLAQVGALRQRGYSDAEIGKKIGCTASWVANIANLLEKGEKRLLAAAEAGHIPLYLAVNISRVNDAEAQQLLLDAYNKGELKGKKVSVVRRILELRARVGKAVSPSRSSTTSRKQLSPAELTKLFNREAERHRLFQKKAELAHQSLTVACEIFKELYANHEFVGLLRTEALDNVPQPLLESARKGGLL